MRKTIKCEKQHTNSLMSHVTKLVIRIVINRIRGRTLDEIALVQYGFMPDKGTGNVLRRLVERSVEKQRDVYTCFIDYSKAFDTVKHESLVELLQSLDVDKSETRLLTNLYWKQTAAVRCGDNISEWLDIKQGVRQGCVASPHLFALYTEMIMRELDDMDGFRIGGTAVNNLRYADDMVIIAESEEQLQRLIDVVVTKSEEKGLYLNSAKSFTMLFSKASQIPTCNINVHGKILKQVHCCCLPTPMTLASGGSSMFPLVVHQPAFPSIWPAVQSLRRGLSTNPGVTMWCVCGCSGRDDVCHVCGCYRGGIVVMDVFWR